MRPSFIRVTQSVTLACCILLAANNVLGQTPDSAGTSVDSEYLLGPGDQIAVWALGMEEISNKPLRVDPAGYMDLPILGRVKAAGLTLEQFKVELVKRLAVQVRQPQVSVDIVEFGSQPVSVIGAVGRPGVHQLQGRRSLAEVLSLAGGLTADAGPRVKITREVAWGKIPLPDARMDQSRQFYMADVNLKDFLSGRKPEQNIFVMPRDVITVPASELVYVVGAVKKSGGFKLNERESISVLQALALAEGLDGTSGAKNSRILRMGTNGERTEIKIDLKKMLEGKTADLALRPDDILFIPDSASKKVGTKVLDAAITSLTGLAIWGGL
ncbi:MAG TPA: polysaccharide biosynthesis/export family protein [Terriglobia bacterium]|nr:polysaccharide biosynthesis/export family protein [Terriglobia bacterium]